MEGSPFLPLSDGLHIEQVTPYTHELLVQVISSSPTTCCPLCGVQDAPPLERAYQLSQEFVLMKASRREGELESWLTEAEHSRLPEFKKMATGIRQDYAAVKAAFASEWSNGKARSAGQLLKAKAPYRVRQSQI